MSDYTLSYSESSKGWTSFFSYIPDWMISVNNRFYSFNKGDLYLHNSDNVPRNNFYGQQYTSKIITIFNKGPLENKLFKTISLQGTAAWDATINTDLQIGSYIEDSWFEEKEREWFAFIRNATSVPASEEELKTRTLNGISKSSSLAGVGAARIANFSTAVTIPTIISIGDYLYNSVSPYTSISLAGQITDIEVDKPNGVNRITFDDTIGGAVTPTNQDDLYISVKNSTAESKGLLGHYALIELENVDTTIVELFAVGSEVMKSFP